MLATRLKVGAQIHLTRHYLTYPAGTHGTITHVYRFNAAAYRVRFAGQVNDEIVYCDAFAALPRVPFATHTAPLAG